MHKSWTWVDIDMPLEGNIDMTMMTMMNGYIDMAMMMIMMIMMNINMSVHMGWSSHMGIGVHFHWDRLRDRHLTNNWHWSVHGNWNRAVDGVRRWNRSLHQLFHGNGNWSRHWTIHWNGTIDRHWDRTVHGHRDGNITMTNLLHGVRNSNGVRLWDGHSTFLDHGVRNLTLHWNANLVRLLHGVRHSAFLDDFIRNRAIDGNRVGMC